MDSIACDSELQEKSETELQRLGDVLRRNCEAAMEEHKAKIAEDPNFEGINMVRVLIYYLIQCQDNIVMVSVRGLHKIIEFDYFEQLCYIESMK